jgi:hypothetical protein
MMNHVSAIQYLHPALGNEHESAGMDSNENNHVNDGGVLMTPVKRKPGRPKGSGRKPHAPPPAPKIKRPVGRPRKDGLPAGSMGSRKLNRGQLGPGRRGVGVISAFNRQTPSSISSYSTVCYLHENTIRTENILNHLCHRPAPILILPRGKASIALLSRYPQYAYGYFRHAGTSVFLNPC